MTGGPGRTPPGLTAAADAMPAERKGDRSLIPAPLPALLGLVAAAGTLTLLVMAWPLIGAVAVLAIDWVLGRGGRTAPAP